MKVDSGQWTVCNGEWTVNCTQLTKAYIGNLKQTYENIGNVNLSKLMLNEVKLGKQMYVNK